MKIAVYTIALNEAKFVKRWHESAKDADFILIADTGSIDDTIALAEELGINIIRISLKPWRFDDARNAALAAIPADVDFCIALDMDEVLVEGWREKLEAINPATTRPRYSYTWSWNPDGSASLVYGGDKIHARNGYRWKHPVHEVLTCQGEEVQEWIGLEIHHHPDDAKSRGQYFPLLELAVKEDPDDDRNAFYYARELFFHNYTEKAIAEFKRHLSLPKSTWAPERAASMRYLAKLEIENTESWLLKAIAESPTQREARCDLAVLYGKQERWFESYALAKSALEIKEKPLFYLCEFDAWSYLPHDLMAIASYRLGNYEEAKIQGKIALDLAPFERRLRDNLGHYERGIDEPNATAPSSATDDVGSSI